MMLREHRLNSCMARIARLRQYAIEHPDFRVRRHVLDIAAEAHRLFLFGNITGANAECVKGELCIIAPNGGREL